MEQWLGWLPLGTAPVQCTRPPHHVPGCGEGHSDMHPEGVEVVGLAVAMAV